MLFPFHRVLRHPTAVDSAAPAASTASPAPAAGQGDPSAPAQPAAAKEATPAPDKKAEADAGKDAKPAAPKESDWQAYQKMQAKFEKNQNARPTKREIELQQKYDGKDEKLIEGWSPQNKPQGAEEAPAAEPATKDAPESAAVPKELQDLVGEKSPLGAKTLAELPGKVKALTEKIQKMNGDFGNVGRLMQEAGVENLGALREEIRGAKRLHTLMQDLKAGKAEAFQFLGIRPQAQADRGRASDPAAGQPPEGILDTELHAYVEQQRSKDARRIEALESQLRDLGGQVKTYGQDYERRSADTVRSTQMNNIVREVNTLAQGAEGLWDSKKDGPLDKALVEYYGTKDGDPYNPALKPILEILDIAKANKLDNLDIAHAYWERQNRPSLLRQAADKAREPFIGKQPTAGLSDLQGNHTGQFKEYTENQVRNMGRKGYPAIPPEWVDHTGTLIASKVPAYARSWLFNEE